MGDDAIKLRPEAFHVVEIATMSLHAGQRPACLEGKFNDTLFNLLLQLNRSTLRPLSLRFRRRHLDQILSWLKSTSLGCTFVGSSNSFEQSHVQLAKAVSDAQYAGQMVAITESLRKIADHQATRIEKFGGLEYRVQRLEIKTDNEP